MKKFILLLLLLSSSANARDLNKQEEARFNDLGKEIRCVVCESEPVATSSAQIALDMRQVIKDRIIAGDDDKKIRQYFADHYGEYVLLRPQINKVTYLLWFTPILLLLFGTFFAMKLMSSKSVNDEVLNEEELKKAQEIIARID